MQEDILHLSIFFLEYMWLLLLVLRFWYGKVCCEVYNDSWPALSLTMQEDILDVLMVIFFAYMLFILSDFFCACVREKFVVRSTMRAGLRYLMI